MIENNIVNREQMEFDVVIVGGGIAGLSSAIRLKQLAKDHNHDISICILEKGAEIGSHILSGAVLDPRALNELLSDWQTTDIPIKTTVIEDSFYFLTTEKSFALPTKLMPSYMHNDGNYIISLGNVCKWLANYAESLGVEIYAGMAVSEVLYNEDDAVKGVIAGIFGVDKQGNPKADYQPGMELLAKYTIFADGVRGNLSKKIIEKYNLAKDADHQKYGIGLKEVWEIDPKNHQLGKVIHTLGYPLDNKTGGGGFLYFAENNQLYIGYVVHLNYENPHLSPYMEFQRYKHHPMIAKILENGRRISYGAKAINEGGFQSVPQLSFDGGVLVGCAAGFVNVPRIKGNHNAMKSGMLAAENIFQAIGQSRSNDRVSAYDAAYKTSWIYDELHQVRNVKPLWSKYGLLGGLLLGGLDMWTNKLFNASFFGTLAHQKSDHASLKRADICKKIDYPKPDSILSFDRLTNVSFSGTNHEENQPVHLHLKDENIPIDHNLPLYAEPAQRYCPAGVYEVIYDSLGHNPKFQINAQNCLHCKTCDIKDPTQNIEWRVPEGSGGPNYTGM